MSDQPWTFGEAVNNCRAASRAQKSAEDALKVAYREFAEAEAAYRLALSEEILQQRNVDVAWSTAPDIARGVPHVAKLRRERDIKSGVVEAMKQLAWRCAADRKDCQRFSEWSQRRELAEGHIDGAEWLTPSNEGAAA